jgi:hypothetical protein
MTYMGADAGAPGRLKQADTCLKRVLKASLKNDVKVRLQSMDCTLTVQINSVDEACESGIVLLYQMISIVTVQTRATISLLKKKLA